MRDPLGLNERLFAAYYPRLIERSENAGQRETRRRLISEATGATIEVGAGSGINLPHYTDRVDELVLTEPSPHMLAHLREALQQRRPPVGSLELVQASAAAAAICRCTLRYRGVHVRAVLGARPALALGEISPRPASRGSPAVLRARARRRRHAVGTLAGSGRGARTATSPPGATQPAHRAPAGRVAADGAVAGPRTSAALAADGEADDHRDGDQGLMPSDKLDRYRAKRDFAATSEPAGDEPHPRGRRLAARRR